MNFRTKFKMRSQRKPLLASLVAIYLLDKIASAKAIASQKKTRTAVKRCINASKPRALVRSNKASEPLLSNTLLLGFFCGCKKIAITIITDNTSKVVSSILYIFFTKNASESYFKSIGHD